MARFLQQDSCHPSIAMMKIKKKNYCKIMIWSSILALLIYTISTLKSSLQLIDEIDRSKRQNLMDQYIKTKSTSKACKQPKLPVFSPQLMQFVKEVDPIDCSSGGTPWVSCENSECKILKEAKRKYGEVSCTFTDQMRINDFNVKDGKITTTNSFYILKASDVVKVVCTADSGRIWKAILTGIRLEDNILNSTGWQYINPNSFKMNVLMFGFDSISRNTFIRKLPRSYKYLTETLNGLVLQGYNIVGDGTPQALIPILTGKTELELPETRKRVPNSHYVNVYPFVWNDFKRNGYVTAFLEDTPDVGIFTYRLTGFKSLPTDHYMRTFYVADKGNHWFSSPLCSGSTPMHMVMLNYIKHFFTVYKDKPKFLFGFHAQLSHDSYNLIGAADNDLLNFLKDLKENGHLNNTILILMSDHGHRFAKIRNTIQGKQEERLPFFSFTFPDWFQKKYKKYYTNFMNNINTLTTPFDIYSTLKTVIDLDSSKNNTLKHRSISLFSKIPDERSCAHAYIEPHWCACLEWIDLPLTHAMVNPVISTLVNKINTYTLPHRKICATLTLSRVLWIQELKPNENLLKFKSNADYDGFVPDLSANTKLETRLFQIKAEFLPGRSLFEATVTHFSSNNSFALKLTDISRTNMYSNQAGCVEQTLPNLRKFCYCIS